MVHFSGFARKMNHVSSFPRAKRARVKIYSFSLLCKAIAHRILP
ncbi:MAG: hypothetical protein U5L45_19370 [Saprospiraceae bacterium]|nr:hypothetical protein [Saprospiraceae bacterium]